MERTWMSGLSATKKKMAAVGIAAFLLELTARLNSAGSAVWLQPMRAQVEALWKACTGLEEVSMRRSEVIASEAPDAEQASEGDLLHQVVSLAVAVATRAVEQAPEHELAYACEYLDEALQHLTESPQDEQEYYGQLRTMRGLDPQELRKRIDVLNRQRPKNKPGKRWQSAFTKFEIALKQILESHLDSTVIVQQLRSAVTAQVNQKGI